MPTQFLSSRSGYIQSYRIIQSANPQSDPEYIEIFITTDMAGTQNPETWVMSRMIVDSVNIGIGERYAITYSNISQAILATIKDAMLNQKLVLLEGATFRTSMGIGGQVVPNKFVLFAITTHK